VLGEGLQFSDAGRGQSKYPFERNDCTVRAYALAAGLSYDDAHNLFQSFGRKSGGRCSFESFMQAREPDIKPEQFCRPRPRVKTLLKKRILKNAVIRISGHVFCVKNNIILDTCDCRNCVVLQVWEFN
jgi:hypothetical protein